MGNMIKPSRSESCSSINAERDSPGVDIEKPTKKDLKGDDDLYNNPKGVGTSPEKKNRNIILTSASYNSNGDEDEIKPCLKKSDSFGTILQLDQAAKGKSVPESEVEAIRRISNNQEEEEDDDDDANMLDYKLHKEKNQSRTYDFDYENEYSFEDEEADQSMSMEYRNPVESSSQKDLLAVTGINLQTNASKPFSSKNIVKQAPIEDFDSSFDVSDMDTSMNERDKSIERSMVLEESVIEAEKEEEVMTLLHYVLCAS